MPRTNSYVSAIGRDEQHNEKAKLAFGEKVRSLMNSLTLSQSDLARQAGLKRDAISTYVRGKVWPDPQNLRKLANALGVTPHDLIPGMSEIEAVQQSRSIGQRETIIAPAPAQMTMVEPNVWRLRLDQTMPLETASKILALLNEK